MEKLPQVSVVRLASKGSIVNEQAKFVGPSIQKVGIEFHLHDLVTLCSRRWGA